MSVMKFTIEIDLESVLLDPKNELSSMPLSELQDSIEHDLRAAMRSVEFDTGVEISLKDENGEDIY